LLFNRGSGSGSGTLENIYVEIVSMESGSGDDATTVYGLNGQSAKNVKNVIVDASNCDFTGVTNAYLVDAGPAVANGVYVIGANDLATTIKNITAGDVAASFASMEALLNDATHGAVVSAFDSSFWTVDAEISLVVPNRLYASRAAVELSDTIVIEKWNNNSFVLPEEVKGTVVSVQIGNTTLTDINGRTVTIGENDFVAQTELGKGKPVFITTEEGSNYTGYANVYTMIIDNKAELDKWQEVASENAVKAGDVLEAQKGLLYNGYFLLNADIEYNGVWKPYKAYGALGMIAKDADGNELGVPGFTAKYWEAALDIFNYARNNGRDDAFGMSYNSYALAGYIAGNLFCQALEAMEAEGKALTRLNLVETLESKKFTLAMADEISYANGVRAGVQAFSLISFFDTATLPEGATEYHCASSTTVHPLTSIEEYRKLIAK
jgi:hypothetical protein